MSGSNVFISYAREDLDFARRLHQNLKDAGYSSWLDVESLKPGQRWKVAIQHAIKNCRYFIAILSSNSVGRNGYVHKELSDALEILDTFPDSNIYLIPIRLDDCKLSRERLGELHWVDMFPSWDDGVARILSALEAETSTRDNIVSKVSLVSKRELSNVSLSEPFLKLTDVMNKSDSPPVGDCPHTDQAMIPVDSNAMLFNSIIQDTPESNDPNAMDWARVKSLEKYNSISGFWSSRWRISSWDRNPGEPPTYRKVWPKWQEGTALVKLVQNWVFIEYEDDTNRYIIRARQVAENRLVGRYMNCESEIDTTPWIGIIVSNSRIDGFWHGGYGRWDFRR